MNNWLRSIVATLALALGSGGLAGAAEFGPVAHASRAIALDGQIDSGDEQLFAKALLQRYGRGEKTEYLRLNSPGGNVYAGARIAEVVHRLGLKVVVGPGEQCSSICMVIFAAGASRGTVPDLLRFGTALSEGRLIGPTSLALMRTPMRTRDGKIAGFPRTDGYAMGWSVLGQGKDCVLFHDGGQQETRTMLIVDPQAHVTVASAQNYERDIHPPLAFALYAAATGKAFPIKPA